MADDNSDFWNIIGDAANIIQLITGGQQLAPDDPSIRYRSRRQTRPSLVNSSDRPP